MSERPTYDPPTNNKLVIHLPVGWTHTTVGISRRDYHQLVTISNSLYPDAKTRVRSIWGKTNETMKNHRTGEQTASMGPQPSKATLTYEFWHSNAKFSISDIPKISNDPANGSKQLQIVQFNKPSGASKKIPDYMTLLVFVLDSDANLVPGASFNDMVLTINLVYEPLSFEDIITDEPDNTNTTPPVPDEGTKPGYNPFHDFKRPQKIENYLKYFDTIFLIDDSGSMAEDSPTKWQQCTEAVKAIAQKAIQYDGDGIDIYFLNSDVVFKTKDEVKNIQDKTKVEAALNKVSPSGGTPTGERLGQRFNDYLTRVASVANDPEEYIKVKPLDLIVITDGSPNDNNLCKTEIQKAAQFLKDKKLHRNHIGVQFVQIGNDAGAKERLAELAEPTYSNGMVDTVPYHNTLSQADLERILLGGVWPNIRVPPKP